MDLHLPAKSLFVLYLVISGNFLANLLGCKIQYTFTHNMLIKHLLGYMTLYFFIISVDHQSADKHPAIQMSLALGIYSAFILTTRMEYKWWTVFILLSMITYILEVYITNNNTNEDIKEKLKSIQQLVIYVNAVIIVVGFLVYLGYKKIEYKGKFDFITFLVGKPNCANTSMNGRISNIEAFKNAFT